MLVLVEGLLQIATQASFSGDFTVARMVIVPLVRLEVLVCTFIVRYIKFNVRRLLLALRYFQPVKSRGSPPNERLSVDGVTKNLLVTLFINRFFLFFRS